MAAMVAIVMLALGRFGGYRINMTPSYPWGLWRIQSVARDVRVGDRVFICPPHIEAFVSAKARGYLRGGLCRGGLAPLIKTVVATGGQRVDMDGSVKVDDSALAHSFVARSDGQGRLLPAFAGGVVPPGFLFLHSDFPKSYDSRYFGPIPRSGVLGLAEEVLTYAP